MANDRNAGRKHRFLSEDVNTMLEMIKDGKRIEDVAKYFSTSRQVVGRYINKKPTANFTHRMSFMKEHKPMTIIDIDFIDKKIQIQNRTEDIFERAFGKIENPNWKQFELFINERVFQQSRVDKNQVLKTIGLDNYDPYLIISKTNGKIEGDNFWIKLKKIN